MNKREAIEHLMSINAHFKNQNNTRSYKDKVTGKMKEFKPTEESIAYNNSQIEKIKAVIDFLFDN